MREPRRQFPQPGGDRDELGFAGAAVVATSEAALVFVGCARGFSGRGRGGREESVE